MVRITEGSFTTDDGVELYTKTWEPDGPLKAILAFIHGFSDHCNAYYSLFPTLASDHQIATHSFDQRGWGRSVHTQAQRGLTGPTPRVLADIRLFLLSLPTPLPAPLFLMGHSMGGGEVLQFMLTTAPRTVPYCVPPVPEIRGLLLESPFVALDPSSQPSAFTLWAGRLAAKVAPNHQMLQKLDATYMSRDPKVREDWVKDPLCHDTGTLAGLAGMMDRAGELNRLGGGGMVEGLSAEVPCPVWCGHGDKDRVVAYDASRRLVERLRVKGMEEGKGKLFRTYVGGYHKLHAELEGMGEEFVRDVGEWIVSVVDGAGLKAKL